MREGAVSCSYIAFLYLLFFSPLLGIFILPQQFEKLLPNTIWGQFPVKIGSTFLGVLCSLIWMAVVQVIIKQCILRIQQRIAAFPLKYEGSPEKIKWSFGEILGIISAIVGIVGSYFNFLQIYAWVFVLVIVVIYYWTTRDSWNFIYILAGYRGYKVSGAYGAPNMVIITKNELLSNEKLHGAIKITETVYLVVGDNNE